MKLLGTRWRVFGPRPHEWIRTAKGRESLIAQTAYLLAEKRGFEPYYEIEDRRSAEQLVDDYLLQYITHR